MSESKKFGAMGGKKRAENLSPDERKAIAQKAAVARWSADLPVADYTGELQIGDLVFPCAVLSDRKTRLLTQTDFMRGMGMYYSGWIARNRPVEDIAAELPHFLSFKGLKPFVEKHLGDLQSVIVKYRTADGRVAHGIKAEIIPLICEVWIDADEAGRLGSRQKKIAAKAKVLMRALAHKGIAALVDEATGFRQDADQAEVARYIAQYVAKDLRQWVRTFPRSFFEQLCKLKGIEFPEDMRLPQYFGHLVNDLVWARLAPGIKDELRKRNPPVNGRRKHKHHQLLTEEIGVPRLLHHLGLLEGMALGYGRGEYDRFHNHVGRALPTHMTLPLFSGVPETPRAPRVKKLKALPAASSSASDSESRTVADAVMEAMSKGGPF